MSDNDGRSPQQIIADVTQRFDDQTKTRRRVLAGTATGLGVLAALPGTSMADEHDEPDADGHDDRYGDDQDQPADGQGDPFFASDVEILNFARTLEFLEARFYRQGLDNIGRSRLLESAPIRELGTPLQEWVFGALRRIQRHEETHAEVLGQTVTELGGQPVAEPEFDFGSTVQNPEEFLATAVVLEDTGVGAYAGAAPSIQNPQLVPPALSIHSVEARHASYLRTLNDQIGFPNAFDPALQPEEVLQRAGQFIASSMPMDESEGEGH